MRALCDAIVVRRSKALAELVETARLDRQQPAVRGSLRLMQVEAERMREHANYLNLTLWHGDRQYVGLHFRPQMFENAC